jgi:hypothetical protein
MFYINILLRYIFYIVLMVCWCCSMLSYSGCVYSDGEYFVIGSALFKERGGGVLLSDVEFA